MMTPVQCPYHAVEDLCMPLAEVLTAAGLVREPADAAPHTDPSDAVPLDGVLPPIPPVKTCRVLVIAHINAWGIPHLDDSFTPLVPETARVRDIRFVLEGLEKAASKRGQAKDYGTWRIVGNHLNSAFYRIPEDHSEDEDLYWYFALRHLTRAREVWEAKLDESRRPVKKNGPGRR